MRSIIYVIIKKQLLTNKATILLSNTQSSSTQKSLLPTLLINKKPPRRRIPRLILLFLTLTTIPLLWQILLINTIQMKPLPLTKWILAHNHLTKWRSHAITIWRLFQVVGELTCGCGCWYWVRVVVCWWWDVIIDLIV